MKEFSLIHRFENCSSEDGSALSRCHSWLVAGSGVGTRSPGNQSAVPCISLRNCASLLQTSAQHSCHPGTQCFKGYKELTYKQLLGRQEGAQGHQLESIHVGMIFAERRIKRAIHSISLIINFVHSWSNNHPWMLAKKCHQSSSQKERTSSRKKVEASPVLPHLSFLS